MPEQLPHLQTDRQPVRHIHRSASLPSLTARRRPETVSSPPPPPPPPSPTLAEACGAKSWRWLREFDDSARPLQCFPRSHAASWEARESVRPVAALVEEFRNLVERFRFLYVEDYGSEAEGTGYDYDDDDDDDDDDAASPRARAASFGEGRGLG